MSIIKNISLPASKVAAMVGKNPYCKINEIYDEMKCRITGEKVKTLNDTETLNKKELVKLFKTLNPGKIMNPQDLDLERILKLSCHGALKSKTTDLAASCQTVGQQDNFIDHIRAALSSSGADSFVEHLPGANLILEKQLFKKIY